MINVYMIYCGIADTDTMACVCVSMHHSQAQQCGHYSMQQYVSCMVW